MQPETARSPEVTLAQLESHLWGAANILRGSPVDRTDWNENLIKTFADATKKKAGEFYTPRSVVRLMIEILDPQEGETIYDPACGTGGMLLAAVEHVRAEGGDPRTFFGKLYGQPVGWGDEGTPTRSCRLEDVGVRSSPQPTGCLLLSASLRLCVR
jgi:hypothetical protein